MKMALKQTAKRNVKKGTKPRWSTSIEILFIRNYFNVAKGIVSHRIHYASISKIDCCSIFVRYIQANTNINDLVHKNFIF